MNFTLENTVELLKNDNFVKFSNTESFPELSLQTRSILKNHGLPTKEFGSYPEMLHNGVIKQYKPNLLEVATFKITGNKYCIDTNNGNFVFCNITSGEHDTINSSLLKFFECKYTVAWYYLNIEFKKIYGRYTEGNNHEKYAKVLREMLNKVEPGIENYSTWEDLLTEKELGVI
jgi:hypothetical protein